MSDSTCTQNRRPSAAEIEENFNDVKRPLSTSEALIEADRCYFCYDAPCTTACPTGIDIPSFIQKIRSDNVEGSAHTILRDNIMGGMCARVCPTEVLCEEACVRRSHEDQAVRIGLLQRYATDPVFDSGKQLFDVKPSTGHKIAVVGGGPAGLSCAHRLACLGHQVTVLNATDKLGGLNEYGIAAYKTVENFAQREVDYILDIGGIDVRNDVRLGQDYSLAQLRDDFDAVFIGIGLSGVNELGLANDQAENVVDAVRYIAQLRQSTNKSELPVARNVVVIGGGMTAIDIAVQSRLLGAETVTIAYRRGQANMGASAHEQAFAQTNGVGIRHWLAPKRLIFNNDCVSAVEFEYTEIGASGRVGGTGESCTIECDVVFKAIGQCVVWNQLGDAADVLQTEGGRIQVNSNRRTSLDNVWAGGDCIYGGQDLTVSAVQDGKLAAVDIDRFLLQRATSGGTI